MLNSAHALVGAFGKNKDLSNAFVDWLGSPDGGQKVVETFAINGRVMHSPAPEGIDPLGRVNKTPWTRSTK